MKLIALYCSNLFVGGGLQVASSVIYEMSKSDFAGNIDVYCSRKLHSILPKGTELSRFNDVIISDDTPKNAFFKKRKQLHYEVWFTVFGPIYFKPTAKVHICGFAQPWIAYPDNEVYKKIDFFNCILTKFKFNIQRKLFKRYDLLVVEGNHIKNALIRQGFCSSKIKVVPNSVSALYRNEKNEKNEICKSINFPSNKYDIVLGFIGRNYLHKNLAILKFVSAYLKDRYDLNAGFVFTLSPDEMLNVGFDEENNFHSVGEITPQQCLEFYNSIDALIFPSLLECFSASPIEAMYMDTPVLCSEKEFLSEVCKDSALYFDPLSSESIGDAIFELYSNKDLKISMISSGRKIIETLPTAKCRALSYECMIKDILKG